MLNALLPPLLSLPAAAQMFVSFDDLDPHQEGRFKTRLTAVEAYFQGERQIGEAVRLFDVKRNLRKLPPVADPHHFIHYQILKLERYYTLLDVRERPRPKKVPDEDVKRAADILAAGYEQQLYTEVGGVLVAWEEPRHFTSIKQATMVSPALRSIMAHYDITAKHMLKRIHQVAPDLAFSALPMKIQLSADNMSARMQYAEWMYQQHLADPSFLYKIMWDDETRIYIGKDLQGKLKVYHYTGRYDGQPPIANPLLNKEHTIRLDVSLFVDAFRGCSHVEVLTGTTNLAAEGRITAAMRVLDVDRARYGLGPYKVS